MHRGDHRHRHARIHQLLRLSWTSVSACTTRRCYCLNAHRHPTTPLQRLQTLRLMPYLTATPALARQPPSQHRGLSARPGPSAATSRSAHPTSSSSRIPSASPPRTPSRRRRATLPASRRTAATATTATTPAACTYVRPGPVPLPVEQHEAADSAPDLTPMLRHDRHLPDRDAGHRRTSTLSLPLPEFVTPANSPSQPWANIAPQLNAPDGQSVYFPSICTCPVSLPLLSLPSNSRCIADDEDKNCADALNPGAPENMCPMDCATCDPNL